MKNIKKKSKILVKTGSIKDFFETVNSVMKTVDKNERIIPKIKTLTFEDPLEMISYLSKAKIILINRIRQHPDTISNLAKDTHRKVSAISRDVNQLEKIGLVKSYNVINPGHGRCKIIELTASELKLEASI